MNHHNSAVLRLEEGATLDAPLPQSATVSDVCEWTHCV